MNERYACTTGSKTGGQSHSAARWMLDELHHEMPRVRSSNVALLVSDGVALLDDRCALLAALWRSAVSCFVGRVCVCFLARRCRCPVRCQASPLR